MPFSSEVVSSASGASASGASGASVSVGSGESETTTEGLGVGLPCTAGGGVSDRAHDDHGKRDEEDPEQLHGLNIGRTACKYDWPNGWFRQSAGGDSQPDLSPIGSLVGLPQHPDQHRPKDPVFLAVDQELGEGAVAGF